MIISACSLSNCIGNGLQENKKSLLNATHGLTKCDFADCDIDTFIGRVKSIDDIIIPQHSLNTRNNRLAVLGLEQDNFRAKVQAASKRYGKDRIAVIIGSTTASIREAEVAYNHLDKNNMLASDFCHAQTLNLFSCSEFVRNNLGLTGPVFSIGSACASSSKALISASRMLDAGLCDAAVIGGIDSLCLTTIYGFNTLGITSNQLMQPSDINRCGLNLGEGAAFMLLEKEHNAKNAIAKVYGYGESTDAHHISAPHTEGLGAKLAMQQTLSRAKLSASDIGYINLHGTASQANDLSESKAIYSLFKNNVACSSTKGWTGHTLGTSGITEAIFCIIAMQNSFIPQSLNTKNIDPDIKIQIPLENQTAAIKYALNNSFGFGGSNSCLALGIV